MAKFDNVKFPGDAQERRWPNRDTDTRGPKRLATPKSKKE